MSLKSQQVNIRRLAVLLGQDLGYLAGTKEAGPNGAKQTFLHVGKVFLRALAKDLDLRDSRVTAAPSGIACSGECHLHGMWQDGGIYISLGQLTCGSDAMLLYRSIRNLHDHKGGYNHYLSLRDLRVRPYAELLETFKALRKDVTQYGTAA